MVRFSFLSRRLALCLAAAAGTAMVPAAAIAGNGNPASLRVPAPDLIGTRWLNVKQGERPSVVRPKARVTVVHFWTYG